MAYAEQQNALHGGMRWDSRNSDSNMEERKECAMTHGFLHRNASGGGLFTAVGNTAERGVKDHRFGLDTLR